MNRAVPEHRQPPTTRLSVDPAVVLLDGTSRLGRDILGNKGHGINAMRRHGLPVPPAFAITTPVCAQFFADPEHTIDTIWDNVLDKMGWLQQETSRTFGSGPRPLLVSVRSGAAQSMPGMLDTVLDLGMDDEVEQALGDASTPAFARDTRDRFRHMYGRIVLGDEKAAAPDDPHLQLRGAIEAVFASWNSPRAFTYRKHHGMDNLGGTAVVVQAMVFGNMEHDSGTGVLFSRNPMTGTDEPFGEWLRGGQGEDVVSGTVDCEPVSVLRDEQPKVYAALINAAKTLERLGTDVQDIEYTVEEGTLWLLQTRAAKRSAQAAVRLALRMREEGLIEDAETLRRVLPAHIETLLLPSLQPETRLAATLLAKGLPACPGVVSGRAYSDVDEAIDAAEGDEDVILVRSSTSPDDVQGMLAARGIVTETGGATSHAAVVSREIGRPTVVGCGTGVAAALAGKLITVDGTEGEVREGILELTAWSESDTPDLHELADIARRISPLRAHAYGGHPRLNSHTDTAVRDAITAGHTDVVSPTPLLTMLTALRLAEACDIPPLTDTAVPNQSLSDERTPSVTHLKVLQAARLKGRVSAVELVATVDEEPADVTNTIAALTKSGLLTEGKTLRLSPDGRTRLTALLAQERDGIDADALAVAYDDFRAVNVDFKALVTDWQLIDGQPNTHDDPDYDAAVLARLDSIHDRVAAIIAAAAAQIPRLSGYSDKLSRALAEVSAGDATWLTRPIIDSYHTVWFELHEELILAAGLTREDEAKAGHAQ